MDIKGAVLDVVEQLTAAGVNATGDYRDLAVPGVLVRPDTAAYDRLTDDAGTIGLRLVGVAGNADPLTSDEQLGDLIGVCQSIADLADIQFTVYTNPNLAADSLPCFTATIISEWEK